VAGLHFIRGVFLFMPYYPYRRGLTAETMKILICTQKVDRADPFLGFAHRYFEEFAKHFDEVTIVALGVGTYDLPKNVRVFSLGKEQGSGAFGYVTRFVPFIVRERKNYDAVFVHMSVEFSILGGIFWRLSGKRIVLWYTHRQNNWRVWLGTFFANVVLSASEKSFPIVTPKLRVIGHGIDTNAFDCPPRVTNPHEPLQLLSVGRITKIKQDEVLITAVSKLRERKIKAYATFVGGAATGADRAYQDELNDQVNQLAVSDRIVFPGPISNEALRAWYEKTDIVVNMTPTGGIDKAVLEAMAAGRVVIVSNTAFIPHFGNYADQLVFKENDADDLADKIAALQDPGRRAPIAAALKRYAKEHFDVGVFIGVISDIVKAR
jgi:glycosyltransferase involved in cell wall biosynthesis